MRFQLALVLAILCAIAFGGPTLREGQFQVEACRGMAGVTDPCYWRFAVSPAACPGGKCKKLVLFFSGGEMNCDDSFGKASAPYSKVMSAYADDGYLAVCAGLYLDGGKASLPFHKATARVDQLVKAITTSDTVRTAWSGEHLLFAGVSNGATAPVVAMARGTYDDQATWKGTKTTAACFHDGIYDPIAADRLLHSQPFRCGILRRRVICDRYFAGSRCGTPALTMPDVAADSLMAVPPSDFAVRSWKLVECGSALSPCALQGDWVPAEPIRQLCANIDAGPQHTCEFAAMPNDSHLGCVQTPQGIAHCKDWFNLKAQSVRPGQ